MNNGETYYDKESFMEYKKKNKNLCVLPNIKRKVKQKRKKKNTEAVYLKFPSERKIDLFCTGIDVFPNEIFAVTDYPKYFISTHGRVARKFRNKYTLVTICEDWNGRTYFEIGKEPMCIYIDELVAKTFLLPVKNTDRVWHMDGDIRNNYHSNLAYVNQMEWGKLAKGMIHTKTIENRQGRYIPTNRLTSKAHSIYSGILARCGSVQSYLEVSICQEWLDNELAFVKWYMDNYYTCGDESMAIDKDLLIPGNKEYAPDKCVLLPQTLNTMLSNCKKHKIMGKYSGYPLGVHYDERLNMYYGQITFFGGQETINLGYWETPEEAFEEYRGYKLKDIKRMADQYKNMVPAKVYEALLRVEVKPY